MKTATIDQLHDEARQGEVFLVKQEKQAFSKHFYIESYGCAMNFADSEVIASLLMKEGYGPIAQP
jgi:tRNA-2-methylthio-N6-dimethylallyladenosine synthase